VGTAIVRQGSRRRAAEDRRCDTPTDSCHNKAALPRPCTPDRTPCERRLLSPAARSPPSTATNHHHWRHYLLTASLLVGNTSKPQTHTHTRLMALCPGLPRVSRYKKGKTNLDFTEARESEWQWHQLGHVQDCTLLQTDNHASTPPLSFLQTRCPSCHPTNSVKALKAEVDHRHRLDK